MKEFKITNKTKTLIKEFNMFFNVTWNANGFPFLRITDLNDNTIFTSALVNNLRIRHKDIPYVLYFVNIYEKSYEPTRNNLSTDFAFVYEDEE